MRISPVRFLVFSVMALPVGFIVTAFVFAVTETPVSAPRVVPWMVGVALIAGAIGAVWRRAD